ncbi:MAG: bifunctional phosphoribosyl-AMP cyclohydrolase/phosphoribosyl-ATP diphosphatase HisIE [Ignavibacterium album]|uniref:bifunctional phosphoribosyl-AMP cyclohydrolase/phosphoribosyl-ATP diphosphatase HisIE n=1 Tax=Ignavibacterium album TaxID=591197 RepID=UPI0026F285C8|nr:bifunctional phosphoribosyl-AMP cyclohydrolase/phosphoribosyl-ATP diphosphatase HisIE [Ignavibacterium album]MBI5662304.1 bifunctional phosphoribosyl-AMP cyclohydrolase/phosphoribosyl-ATP diphosphatase HisIE [Ignavibacterium album]
MIDISKLNFKKLNGLIPAIVVDYSTDKILMLGFMNEEALRKTIELNKVTFFSRSKNRLWTKGETSGNFLLTKNIISDCDDDSIIVYAEPQGPTCHSGNYSCFGIENDEINFLGRLNDLIYDRKKNLPEGSYTSELFNSGSDRIIQKVGEEAVEVLIAVKNKSRKEIVYESADLLYHLMVMLADNDIKLSDVVDELKSRHK